MARLSNHCRHEFWWWAEQHAGKLWHRAHRALHPEQFQAR